MVVGLLLLIFVGALQLALGLYVRNVVVDAAGEGARYGALAGSGPDEAVQRTRDILALSVSPTYQGDVTASYIRRDGLDLLRVHVEAPMPVIGLLGPARTLSVDGHALVEPGGAP